MMKTANLTPLEMEQYLKSLKPQMDRENIRTYDILKGKRERDFEIAKNLKYNGAPIELISKSTGLTMEQIQRL